MSLIDKLTDDDIMQMVINAYNRGYVDGQEKERATQPSGLAPYYGPLGPYGFQPTYQPAPVGCGGHITVTNTSSTFPGAPPLVYTLGQEV